VDAAKLVDLRTAPELPAVPRPADVVTNRPTMPMADYLTAKNAAAAKLGAGRPQTGTAPPPATGVTLYTQVGSTNESQTTSGNVLPPDGDVATSASWLMQVNNDVVTMYNWNTNAFVQKKFNTFFQDATYFKFDPRVIYDPYWDRFAVLVDACNPCSGSGTQSFFFLAVSQTGDPTGAYWVWSLPPGLRTLNDFADFPQLGMDLNSIIVTYNEFAGSSFVDGRTLGMAKAYLYNNHGFGYNAYGGGSCTVAPPYLLDNHAAAYMLAFCPGDTKVHIGTLTNSGLDAENLVWGSTVNVAYNGIPPSAQQPGTTYTLDTGDNRFENRSLQVGSRILNAATVNSAGLATAIWYNFNTGGTPSLVAENGWFAGLHSYDWHPSITANTVGASSSPVGEVFGTWMSTDPVGSVLPQLRAVGWIGDDAGAPLSGLTVYTSPLPLTGQTDINGVHRTGDYSYITTYPAAALGCQAGEIGILEGETATGTAGLWGTHIGIVKHC
jgi:hypothetical protein